MKLTNAGMDPISAPIPPGLRGEPGISDNPAFAIRGIIEGFYGTPWSHEARLDMIDFIAAHGMNTFVYSPKDDPLMRHRWRESYRGDDLQRLKALIARCRERGVNFVFCLSPGLSIQYSSENDTRALSGKFSHIADLGVTMFGLLLDDIPTELQHGADKEIFTDLVDAHIHLIDQTYAALIDRDARCAFFVCPTVYWGRGDEPYLVRMGREIDPRVEVLHTGRAICSPTIDLIDAATVTRALSRPVTYWDNYPVNDVAMTSELHVGPYLGRDRHLYRFSTGVIANGMELAESSKIAFATIADYLWAPESYDPERSWRRAIAELLGPQAEAFATVAENLRSSCLSDADASTMTAAVDQWRFAISVREYERAEQILTHTAAHLADACDELLSEKGSGSALVAEARPWVQAARDGADVFSLLARHASREHLDPAAASQIERAYATFTSNGKRVFGDLLDMTVRDALST